MLIQIKIDGNLNKVIIVLTQPIYYLLFRNLDNLLDIF